MVQRGDPGWNYTIGSRLVAAVVFIIAGCSILITDRQSSWVAVTLIGLGLLVLVLLYIAYRRGRY